MNGEQADGRAGSQPDDVSGRGLLAMRFQLPYADLDAFIRAYAINMSAAGMFIAAEAPPTLGTIVRFEVVLADQRPILRAEGEVVYCTTLVERVGTKLPPTAPGDLLSGFSVRFTRLDAAGRELLTRVLAHKAAHPEQYYSNVPQPYPAHPSGSHAPGLPPPGNETPAPATEPASSPSAAKPTTKLDDSAAAPAEEAALSELLRPAAVPSPPVTDAARLLDELLARRPS